ncbi:MAG: permease [Hyphomicrobiales bacterium]|nr:permease [Hyphomicrobiales bacterium]
MVWTTTVLWSIALACGVIAYRRSDDSFRRGLKIAWRYALVVGPRIVLAMLLAGILVALIPNEVIARWLGDEAGFRGILLASLVGGIIPGGPILSFPIALALFKAGVGVPQLVAFLSGWSVFAMHRVIIYEIPLLGWQFTAVRLLVSLALPPISGILAGLLMTVVMG